MKTRWTPTADARPAEDQIVIAILPSGDERRLKFHRGLWFMPPDWSMYGYFTPTYWRPLKEGE